MNLPTLIWADFRFGKYALELVDALSETYLIDVVCTEAEVFACVGRHSPDVICFDYDYPDHSGLIALQHTKLQFPAVPILMLTQQHSEDLAVWAFRTRVWDYLVKPVRVEDIRQRIKILSTATAAQYEEIHRHNFMPLYPIPIHVKFTEDIAEKRKTSSVVAYVRGNFHQEITLKMAADLCGMEPFHFSRTFKHEYGLTFHEFLIQHRIGKAMKLLQDSHSSVTEVGMAVGFSDLSYFSQTFQRYVGIRPSKYRQAYRTV